MLHNDYRTPKMERKEWPVIPEDVYQVAIEDITTITVKKFHSEEEEDVFNFQFVILEEGEYKGQRLFKRVRPIVFDGGGKNRPSYLYQIFKAAMKVEPSVEQVELGLTGKELNELIGKQIRVNVKVSPPNNAGKTFSNVEGVMHAKTEMAMPALKTKAPGSTKVAEEGIDDDVENEQDEVEPKDMPF